MQDTALSLLCEESELAAVLHLPDSCRNTGVVIVVGGPQYRVGSHRQFLLLARSLAAAHFAVLRFDYRGMGDSNGNLVGFEHIATDIRTAVDAIIQRVPSVTRVVLWGLCDGATAASLYATSDPRVVGLALLNPWIRNGEGPSRSQTTVIAPAASDSAHSGLAERISSALDDFSHPILLILSGADILANEFEECVRRTPRLSRRLQAADVTRHTLEPANHTFSRREWRDFVSSWTCEWLNVNYT